MSTAKFTALAPKRQLALLVGKAQDAVAKIRKNIRLNQGDFNGRTVWGQFVDGGQSQWGLLGTSAAVQVLVLGDDDAYSDPAVRDALDLLPKSTSSVDPQVHATKSKDFKRRSC